MPSIRAASTTPPKTTDEKPARLADSEIAATAGDEISAVDGVKVSSQVRGRLGQGPARATRLLCQTRTSQLMFTFPQLVEDLPTAEEFGESPTEAPGSAFGGLRFRHVAHKLTRSLRPDQCPRTLSRTSRRHLTTSCPTSSRSLSLEPPSSVQVSCRPRLAAADSCACRSPPQPWILAFNSDKFPSSSVSPSQAAPQEPHVAKLFTAADPSTHLGGGPSAALETPISADPMKTDAVVEGGADHPGRKLNADERKGLYVLAGILAAGLGLSSLTNPKVRKAAKKLEKDAERLAHDGKQKVERLAHEGKDKAEELLHKGQAKGEQALAKGKAKVEEGKDKAEALLAKGQAKGEKALEQGKAKVEEGKNKAEKAAAEAKAKGEELLSDGKAKGEKALAKGEKAAAEAKGEAKRVAKGVKDE